MSLEADRSKQVVLITGATGAIGQAIGRQIAAKPGYEVVLAARNEDKAQQAVREIIRATAYRQSKQANRMLTVALAERLKSYASKIANPPAKINGPRQILQLTKIMTHSQTPNPKIDIFYFPKTHSKLSTARMMAGSIRIGPSEDAGMEIRQGWRPSCKPLKYNTGEEN